LKRNEEMLRNRKLRQTKAGRAIADETDKDREDQFKQALYADLTNDGAYVIQAVDDVKKDFL